MMYWFDLVCNLWSHESVVDGDMDGCLFDIFIHDEMNSPNENRFYRYFITNLYYLVLFLPTYAYVIGKSYGYLLIIFIININ